MTSKAIKGYKFVVGGKSRPGIVGVKPKSGGVVDEFKARKLKQLGRTQRKLQAQDKEMGKAVGEAKKRGASRKDLVKGRKFQRDIRRTKREGDKLRKDVLRVGKAMGGVAEKPRVKRKPIDTKPKPGLPPKEIKKGPAQREKKPRRIFKEGGFPDLSGDGKVTKKDILMGRGVLKKKNGKKKFGGGKK